MYASDAGKGLQRNGAKTYRYLSTAMGLSGGIVEGGGGLHSPLGNFRA